ncbi:MAG TPA: beta-ketoacyl-ACP synthase II [Candidatus Borkfalkia avicola]|uniref:3-oxoacyl-[acyl-carrier-protein] synthase 2 n=1 Tax=Candidatus Borkfalkia avicola TaxID=2838503 RepID=A0A9D2D6A8_9FIRM|nr:beta-ketoacyl-ACP synthase II [Candidatus Borkfalkia avicola]
MEKRVVVTGLGAVSPLGNDVKSTWENMKKGVNGIDTVTKFDASGYKCTLAGEVRGFDPALYMPKGDVRKTDPYCQYALAAAVQAYEDGGMTEESVAPERFGVYIGSGIGGIHTLVAEHAKLIEKGPGRVSPFFVPMMIANIASGTVAIRYNAQGPNIAVVTACATSTNSIGEAYRAIKHGYADVMLAGGSEAAITPMCFAGFISCQALSQSTDKDRASIPFDKERGGFVMGEGGAVVLLEEYEHAKARGAKIYAEVVGYGCTNDAYHMTAPNPEAVASAKAIELAAKEGGISAGRDVYVNAHGTGTPLNDKTETRALKRAFGEDAYKLHVSSTKSMTGHMLGAAGGIEAIASVLALHEGVVPPTINYKVKDEECDLDITPNEAVSAPLKFALSTSLGFGGHNGCLAFRKL